MVVWLGIGIIVVSLSYLFPSQALDPWVPLNTAGVAVLAYLAALMAGVTRTPFPRRSGFLAWAVFLVVGGALALAWTGFDAQAHFQSDQLTLIRTRIARGIINDQLSSPLLETLDGYYAQHGTKKKTLQEVFHQLHPGAVVGTNLHQPTYERDSLLIVVSSLSDDAVSLVGQEANVMGKNPGFRNWNGRSGMIQYRATLTSKGVAYESEN